MSGSVPPTNQNTRWLTPFCSEGSEVLARRGRLGFPHALSRKVAAKCIGYALGGRRIPTDLLQIGQVGQSFVDSEIVRVAKRSFRPATAPFFEVLFQVEVLVVDMQARVHAVLDHPGAELAWGFLPYHSVEDQLHTVRASQIQRCRDDLFKKLTAPQRPVEDLRKAHFHPQDRQSPVVASPPVFRPQWERDA